MILLETLATLTLLLHFSFILFVIFGALLILKFKKIILVVIDLIRHNLEVKEEEILVLTEMDKIKTDSVLIEIGKMDQEDLNLLEVEVITEEVEKVMTIIVYLLEE